MRMRVRARRRARRERGADLPRGRRRGHGVHPRRALLRGPRQAPRRRGAQGAAGAGRKGGAVLDDDGGERRVPIDELVVGDRFVVRPGEKLATDGVVEEGRSAIDRSLLTGESVPVEVEPGDAVVGRPSTSAVGSSSGPRSVGADTALAQIARLVTEAQSGKAPVQRLADRVSAVFVPGGDRDRRRDARLLARRRRRRGVRLRRRGGGADHRLPLRARPGDADRAARRHGAGRATRHPDPRAGGARVDPPRRHDRARQDGHGHDGQDGVRGRRSRAGVDATRRCGSSARSRTLGASGRAGDRRRRAADGAALRAVESF